MKYIEELEKFVEIITEKFDVSDYFIQNFLDFKQDDYLPSKKKVAVIGDSFYSLYVKAYGLKPIVLNGGSYLTGDDIDMFPQISDPIAKSTIGLLLDKELNLLEECVAVLVVAINDSYKKAIAYLRNMGVNVIQVEPTPYILDKPSFALYKQQLSALNDISKLVFGLFNESTFKNELKDYENAYELMQSDEFIALPTMVKDFFLHVLHTAYDKKEWYKQVESYLQEVPAPQKVPVPVENQVTLMGSPIHLPNYKVYQIFNDLGIVNFENNCMDFPNYYEIDLSGGALKTLSNCFEFQYRNSYRSETLGNVELIEIPEGTNGIIYYLLKGQTSQAYTADRIEEIAIAQGIPYICVETDYTYTDMEQMKIRIEAFHEMLLSNAKKNAIVN